jgi:hypothetical protein
MLTVAGRRERQRSTLIEDEVIVCEPALYSEAL